MAGNISKDSTDEDAEEDCVIAIDGVRMLGSIDAVYWRWNNALLSGFRRICGVLGVDILVEGFVVTSCSTLRLKTHRH